MRPLLPRVVVLTGATGGIGSALALAYAAPGMCLGLQGRNAELLATIVASCRARGAEVVVCALDVREESALRHWLEDFDDQHQVDLLIANAGMASVVDDLTQWESPLTVAAVINTNLMGTLNTVGPLAERMRARGAGHIALVISLAAFRGMSISPAYCASKAALMAWGQSVRPLLANKGVALTLIYPGFVQSKMSDAFPGRKPFLITAQQAATRIQRGLNARSPVVVFPAALGLGTKLLQFLPDCWADAVLGWLGLSPRTRR